ncbi:MAG: polysaccharide deacetylase family protein [Tepidiformaceae bacterium]
MCRAVGSSVVVMAALALAACGDDSTPTAVTASPGISPVGTPTATATTRTFTPLAATVMPVTSTATARPATATVTPTPVPAPIPTAGVVITNGSRSSGLVALTLDMGGRVEPAVDIMNWLIANNIRSTIFMTGAMAENQNTEAGREVLRIVDANPALFELASHSYSHSDFRELSAAAMAEELGRTERAMAKYASQDPRPLFRPPFGGVNDAVVAGVAAAGYPRIIMWDVDTIDWKPEADGGPTTAFMVSKVVTNARGGSIVLMHLGGYNTLQALPGIVEGLRAKGLGFATVSELLSR